MPAKTRKSITFQHRTATVRALKKRDLFSPPASPSPYQSKAALPRLRQSVHSVMSLSLQTSGCGKEVALSDDGLGGTIHGTMPAAPFFLLQ